MSTIHLQSRSRSRISGKGVQKYKGGGLTLLILSHFSLITHENEIIWKLFHFHGIFKKVGGGGGNGGFEGTPSGSPTAIL